MMNLTTYERLPTFFSFAEFLDGLEEIGGYAQDALVAVFQLDSGLQ
jgi:hypothetical protein